ncbi:MAG: hypothetical protein HY332_01970 [Chloroflexi bacterium]|nr:hypothetical protein [Chloroflexota bacterium]
MSLGDQETVSAQVVLRPAGGRTLDGQSTITSETIGAFLPSSEAVATAREAFRAAGFDVGPVVGNSFSITAPAGTFRKAFNTQLRREARGSVQAVKEDGGAGFELPLEHLPEPARGLVSAVTFTPPPDFGPTNFGP